MTTRFVFTALVLIGNAAAFSLACPFLNSDSTAEFMLAVLGLLGVVTFAFKSLEFIWTFK